MVPGEYLLVSDPIDINGGRPTRRLEVANTGDRPFKRYRIQASEVAVSRPWAAGDASYLGTTLMTGRRIEPGVAERLHLELGRLADVRAAADRLDDRVRRVRLLSAFGPHFTKRGDGSEIIVQSFEPVHAESSRVSLPAERNSVRSNRGSTRGSQLAWRLATVIDVLTETPRTRTLVLHVPGWPGHRAGQHVDVRLTAEDGYQTQRSYSIASAPQDARVALTVDRLDDGEVSPYLTDVLGRGDRLELRGPIGGHFVWDVGLGGPLLLVAGGSGIVPLMAMLRHRAAALETADARHAVPARLLYSSRRWDDVIYRGELARLAQEDETLEVALTFTREPPRGWTGFRRRVDRMMLAEVAWPPGERPHVFVCGPTLLVEAAASALVELGHDPALVKTERFGPTGGSA